MTLPKPLNHRRRAKEYPGTQFDLMQHMRYDLDTGEVTRLGYQQNHGHIGYDGYRRIRMPIPPFYDLKSAELFRTDHLAWFYVTGTWPDGWIEHINQVKCHDNFDNLVLCDPTGMRWAYDIITGRFRKTEIWTLRATDGTPVQAGARSHIVSTPDGTKRVPLLVPDEPDDSDVASDPAWENWRDDETQKEWWERTRGTPFPG